MWYVVAGLVGIDHVQSVPSLCPVSDGWKSQNRESAAHVFVGVFASVNLDIGIAASPGAGQTLQARILAYPAPQPVKRQAVSNNTAMCHAWLIVVSCGGKSANWLDIGIAASPGAGQTLQARILAYPAPGFAPAEASVSITGIDSWTAAGTKDCSR